MAGPSEKPQSKKPKPENRLLDRPLNKGRLKVDFKPSELGMAPLSLESLVPGQPAPADLYLALYNRGQNKVEMKPASEKGEEFRAVWRDHLLEAGQTKVYVKTDEAEALNSYFTKHAREIIDNPDTSPAKKASFVQEMAIFNLRILFASHLKPKDLEKSVSQAKTAVDELAKDSLVLDNLAEMMRMDYSVYTHCSNVCLLAMAFGRYLRLSSAKVHTLGMGGLLHDVGMAKIPPGLIDKAGPLTDQERVVMQKHPRQGHQMLQPVISLPYDVLTMILHHHENADGTGYPSGLKAKATPELARLLRVTDAYDAMTSNRPYKDAKSAFDAAGTLVKSMDNIFGEDITPSFIRFLASPFFTE